MRVSISPARGTAWIALALVSAGAGVASYIHGYGVCVALGTGPWVAAITPALADLVILGESAALLEVSRNRQPWPLWDIAALVLAILATLTMNVAAAHPAWLPLWLVDAWPPVAFGLALHCLIGMVRRGRSAAVPVGIPPPGDQCGHAVPAGASDGERIVAAFLHARDCEDREPSYREVGRQVGVHHATVGKFVRAHLEATAPQTPAVAVPGPSDLPRSDGQPPRPAAMANGSHGG